MIRHGVVATLALLFAAAPVFAAGDEAQLKELGKAWIGAFNAGDAKALAALYTTDGMLLPPFSESVKGRTAIAEFWAGFMTGVKGELEVREVMVQGRLAYMIGVYKIHGETGDVLDRGKYIEVWKRGEGKWQLHRDIWNTSLPLPAGD